MGTTPSIFKIQPMLLVGRARIFFLNLFTGKLVDIGMPQPTWKAEEVGDGEPMINYFDAQGGAPDQAVVSFKKNKRDFLVITYSYISGVVTESFVCYTYPTPASPMIKFENVVVGWRLVEPARQDRTNHSQVSASK